MKYYRFWMNKMGRDFRRKVVGPKGYSTPGHMHDPDPRKKFKHKFDKWVDLPDAAARLYWRTHGPV